MSEQPPEGDQASPSPPEPAPRTASRRSAPVAPDPEDWQSTAGSGDDERYLRERPPHWE